MFNYADPELNKLNDLFKVKSKKGKFISGNFYMKFPL
jgi:hypothetical protein